MKETNMARIDRSAVVVIGIRNAINLPFPTDNPGWTGRC